MKQKVVLAVAFLLPAIGIVIFRFYSQSHFDVRMYYQNELPHNLNCSDLSVPYRVDNEIRLAIDNSNIDKPFAGPHYKIFGFSPDNGLLKIQMNLIADAFFEVNNVDVFLVEDSLQVGRSEIPDAANIQKIKESKMRIDKLKECVFLFDNVEDNAVLIDDANIIRGFYNLLKDEQVDSLIIETKILVREKKLRENVHSK